MTPTATANPAAIPDTAVCGAMVASRAGWACSLPAGHPGPCAALGALAKGPATKPSGWSVFWNRLGNAIGESLFGGGR